MKHDAVTDEILSEIRTARLGRFDEQRSDGTGDTQMLAANAAYKTMMLEIESTGHSCSWRSLANVWLSEAFVYPPHSARLRAALVRTAALLVAWIESLDQEAR